MQYQRDHNRHLQENACQANEMSSSYRQRSEVLYYLAHLVSMLNVGMGERSNVATTDNGPPTPPFYILDGANTFDCINSADVVIDGSF